MKLNFTKSKISIGKERIFFPETTPCDEHPSFSMLNCERKCPNDYQITFCLVKIEHEMNTNGISFLSAISNMMKSAGVVKLSNVFVELSDYSRNRYIPTKSQAVITIKLTDDMNNVDVTISKDIKTNTLSRCGQTTSFNQSLNNPHITLSQFHFTECTEVYVLRDMENCLWNIRGRLLDDWQQMRTYIKHGLPIPAQENENKIFIVLQPRDEFEMFANGMCEGVSDIYVKDFGYDYKTSDHIYGSLLANEIAIIRVDSLPHPTAKESTVNVYTCVPVNLIPTTMNINMPGERTYEACKVPIQDMLIQHMGEYKRISDVKVNWEYDVKVDDIVLRPATVNTFSSSKIDIILGEVYGETLHYHLTFSSNNIDVDTSLTKDESFRICNSGCKY